MNDENKYPEYREKVYNFINSTIIPKYSEIKSCTMHVLPNVVNADVEYLSELSGVIRTSAQIKIYNIKIQTENKFVANRIFGLFKILFDINHFISMDKSDQIDIIKKDIY